MITQSERKILRELAKKQLDIAHSPAMDKLRIDWQKHGSFSGDSRPMIQMELWTFGDEIIPPLMQCESENARGIEWELHSNIVNHTLFNDDSIVNDYIPITAGGQFVAFDIEGNVEHTEGLGHRFLPELVDLSEDFHKIKPSKYSVDASFSSPYTEMRNEIIGDILPQKRVGFVPGFCLTYNIVRLMGLENMFIAMSTEPELFTEMMTLLTNDYLNYIDLLEREGAFLPTIGEVHLPQGSHCYTDKLPNTGVALKSSDIWCYMDSQESSGISPDMFNALIAPHYKRISDRFGLLSYGCCEAVDSVWNESLSKFGNMGKISVSPWCNESFMGEVLRGRDIVYLRKPTPNLLGVGDVLDEDAVTDHFTKTVQAAAGCTLEIAQRDVYSVSNSPQKVRRYVELIRNICSKHCK